MIRTDKEGYARTAGPGLGVRVDWEAVKKATILDISRCGRKADARNLRINVSRETSRRGFLASGAGENGFT